MQEYSYAPSRTATGDRSTFIVKTYLHLLGAIMAFVALEVFIFASGLALPLAQAMMGVSWLLVLGAFMVVSWLGSRIAITAESKIAQYAALGAYVLAEAIIFVPLLLIAGFSAYRLHHHTGRMGLISENGKFNQVFGRCHNNKIKALPDTPSRRITSFGPPPLIQLEKREAKMPGAWPGLDPTLT